MTVLEGKLSDIARARAVRSFTITAYEDVRGNESADGLVIAWEHVQTVNADTSFTTPDLEPGGAWVQFVPNGKRYYIEIPDWGTPVNLKQLIEAFLQPPASPYNVTYVVNGGGVPRIEKVTKAWYDANPHDPDTLYVIP